MASIESAATGTTSSFGGNNNHDDSDAQLSQIQQKYEAERNRRIKSEGQSQYMALHQTEQYKHFVDDIFDGLEGSLPGMQLQENQHFKFVVLGAGYGGLMFAIRLIQAGFEPEDIAIVDVAGGFGGTWYWNRYPGLMCDIESYMYMPLLEETGYMPKHKYAYGYELREHANRMAATWNLKDRAAFRTALQSATWSEEQHEWILDVTQKRSPSNEQVGLKIRSDFVLTLGGLASFPKLPQLPNMEQFQGEQFHTARWNYKITGGSPRQPSLTNLEGKRVGIIGTGATAVQVVPRLAEWCKELYVFQRTPSAVGERGQRPTDPSLWEKEIAHKEGWQRERQENFAAFLSADPSTSSAKDMVGDGWTTMPSYSALAGGPRVKHLAPEPEALDSYVKWLHKIDLERANKIRERVSQTVKDPETAQRLTPWYPSWCKRPCFHDEYLKAFNYSHVTLVDTGGKGVDGLTKDGIVFQGREYPVDVLVWSTGYAPPMRGGPDTLGGFSAVGRDGLSMKEKWQDDLGTLHGVLTHGFPNFIFVGPAQIGISGNLIHTIDATSEHVAYIISKAHEKLDDAKKVIIEPTLAAEKAWTQQVVNYARGLSGMSGCTPSYFNLEGEADKVRNAPPEVQAKAARASTWGAGITDYISTLQRWRAEGNLQGIDIKIV